MSSKQTLLKASDFAALCHVNKKTLHYYDQIDLFKPHYVNERGYRYYSYQQYDTFFLISTLKEMGMSLQDIQTFLKKRSVDQFLETLTLQKAQLESRIHKLTTTASIIENMIEATTNTKHEDLSAITVRTMAAQPLILSAPIKQQSDHEIFTILSEHMKYCEDYELQESYYVGSIVTKDKLLAREFTAIDYFFTQIKEPFASSYYTTKPAGEYVTAFHIGDYLTTHLTYERILTFLNDHHYQIIGSSYEETLLDFYSFNDCSHYVTKISIQVQKSDT